MPTDLPTGFAVRCEPAVRSMQAYGDWCEVVPLADEKLGVVVGDGGRGLTAAAAGEVRDVCRALLALPGGPGEVLGTLNGIARTLQRRMTVFCAIVDPATGRVRYANAGNPPAALVHADGTGGFLSGAGSAALADVTTGADGPRPEASAALRPGSMLLVYTDGLVERHDEPTGTGMAGLLHELVAGRDRHQHEMADRLVAATRPDGGYTDDVALLLYRQPDQPALQVDLHASAGALAGLRTRMRRWMAGAGVPPQLTGDILVAVGEACANAIEHGYGFAAGHRIDVRMAIHAGVLEAVVRDGGSWVHRGPLWRPVGVRSAGPNGNFPAPEPTVRGRGLPIMEALMDEADIQGGPRGTTVRLVKDLRRTP